MSTLQMKPVTEFSDLVSAHQANIWRYLRFLGADAAQAEDLTQETFLAIFKKPICTEHESATAKYLRTVARNLFFKLMRKQKNGPTVEDLQIAESVWERLSSANSESADSGAAHFGNNYLDALDDCLSSLTGKARRVLELRYQEEQSRSEMAALLELSTEGVKTLLRRSKQILRDCVQRKINHDF